MSTVHCVTSGRATLAVEIAGTGRPIVFLHSNAGDRREWQVLARRVSATHQAVAYDRRGFGETCAAQEDHSAVADVVAVLDAVTDGTPAVLVGCSMGGKIALNAALQHPERVRGLMLIAPSVEGAPVPNHPTVLAEMLAWAQKAEASGDPHRAGAARARLWLDGALAPEGRVQGPTRQLFLEMIGAALRKPAVGENLDRVQAYERLGEIAAPTLVIQGDLDFPHIQERSRHVAAMVPGGAWYGMAGVAHLPALEQPEAIAHILGDFLIQCSG